jgi:hypothetical protein
LSLYTSPIKASNKSSFELLLTCAIVSSTIGIIGQGEVLGSLANSIWDCLYISKTARLIIFSNISSSFAANFAACYCVICPLSLIGVSFDIYMLLAARFIIS